MRVRILKTLNAREFEPFDVSRFEVGHVYDLGYRLAELLIVHGCAELEMRAVDRAADYSWRPRDKGQR